MTRDITTTAQAASAAPHVVYLYFVELAFDSGFVRVTNAGYNQAWNGHSWLAIGNLGSVSTVEEGGSLEAFGITLMLSGVNPDYIASALGENCQGRSCKVWLAFLDVDTYVALADPVLVFNGRMDTMNIDMGQTATVTIAAESRLIDLDRPRVSRWNHEDQQIKYPGDRGFEFVTNMVEKELLWGKE